MKHNSTYLTVQSSFL